MTNIDFENKHDRHSDGKFAAKEGAAPAVTLAPSSTRKRIDALVEAKMLTPIALGGLFKPVQKADSDEIDYEELDFQDDVMVYHMGEFPDGARAESTSDLDTVRYAMELDAERGRVFGERYASILRNEPVTLNYQGTEYQAHVKSTDGLYLELEDRRDAEGRYVDDTNIDYISLADPRLTSITQDEYSIAGNESRANTISRLGYGKQGYAEKYMEGRA